MKTLQKFAFTIVLITFLVSCQSGTDVKQILSNQDTRKAVIDSIANDSSMSKEMMGAMMNSNNGKMMMQGNEKMSMMMMENHTTMMKMMKDNPGMMQGMMADMMETCKGDSAMMSGMCKTMMGDPKMMDMMQKMKGKNTDMNKMKGMDKMDNKSHH
jgi:hypothetical protein